MPHAIYEYFCLIKSACSTLHYQRLTLHSPPSTINYPLSTIHYSKIIVGQALPLTTGFTP
ncbi:MAG: hypothetical protein LBE12_11080 [Planctomycetaceae bacterium]|nr:hypothetical protein [Planctomycetaceae bacterium]